MRWKPGTAKAILCPTWLPGWLWYHAGCLNNHVSGVGWGREQFGRRGLQNSGLFGGQKVFLMTVPVLQTWLISIINLLSRLDEALFEGTHYVSRTGQRRKAASKSRPSTTRLLHPALRTRGKSISSISALIENRWGYSCS